MRFGIVVQVVRLMILFQSRVGVVSQLVQPDFVCILQRCAVMLASVAVFATFLPQPSGQLHAVCLLSADARVSTANKTCTVPHCASGWSAINRARRLHRSRLKE
jgi:hypothetical protein